MWLTESEEATWERLAEAMDSMKEKELASRILTKYTRQEDQDQDLDAKDGDANIVSSKHIHLIRELRGGVNIFT